MALRLALAIVLAALPAVAAHAVEPARAIAADVLPDETLATLRGGFRLPSGIDVSLSVQTDTAVNGALLLRSVFTAADGRPTLQVLAPADGRTVAAPKQGSGEVATTSGVSVQFDPRGGGTITAGAGAAPTVAITTGPRLAANDALASGLRTVDVAAGASAVETPGGAVSVANIGDNARVRLEGAGLDVSHIVGNAFGSVIANNASDRAIDTTTTVSLDLANAGPDVLGSAMFRVENVAVEAARLGAR